MGRQEETIVNINDFGGVVKNVYRGVKPINMQEVDNVNVLKNGEVAGID